MTSAPLVAGDLIVVGGWVTDNQQIGNPSGVIRAYSARDGHFVWAWDLGNPDAHGMPAEGGQFTRSTPNAWTNLSYDPALNTVYAPTGNSSPDYFAGDLRTPQADKYSSLDRRHRRRPPGRPAGRSRPFIAISGTMTRPRSRCWSMSDGAAR